MRSKERKKPMKRALTESSEEEDGRCLVSIEFGREINLLSTADGDLDRGDLEDLIDDNPIEEDGSDSDGSDVSGRRSKKKKSDDDDDLDDRLEDEDYDLIEENLGVKLQRKLQVRVIKMNEVD